MSSHQERRALTIVTEEQARAGLLRGLMNVGIGALAIAVAVVFIALVIRVVGPTVGLW